MEINLLVAISTMGGLGLVFATILAIADRKLHVDENPLIEKVFEALPHINCGACGNAGCHDFAVNLVAGRNSVDGCPIGGQELADVLAELLNVKIVQQASNVARLLCQGDNQTAYFKNSEYYGPKDCAAQAIVEGGNKLCAFSCLGGGDCVSVCPVGAIEMNSRGLPDIYEDICTGCGLCIEACPRGVLELHPKERNFFVFCKNHDDPLTSRKVCAAACTACGICVRASDGAIEIIKNLAVITHENIDSTLIPIDRCKTHAIHYMGD